MMSPDGTLGEVPDEQVPEAQMAGFRAMTSADMRQMYQNIFMQHSLIQHQEKEALKKFQSRRSLRHNRRRKH